MMNVLDVFCLMIRRPPRSTLDRSSAVSDVYKRQAYMGGIDSIKSADIADVHSAKVEKFVEIALDSMTCLLYTSPSPRDRTRSRMPSSA